jgi:membrane protease YdiL (CAAX protease family)
MKSVLFEELIFRGVLLYILIKWLGHVRAIIISSVAFGIYHWFSYELFGNPGQMIVIFLLTGSIGLLYATIAMHFGWNFTKGFIFSEGATGNGILVQAKPLPNVQVSYFVYAIVILTPFVLFFLLNFLLLKNRAYRI